MCRHANASSPIWCCDGRGIECHTLYSRDRDTPMLDTLTHKQKTHHGRVDPDRVHAIGLNEGLG